MNTLYNATTTTNVKDRFLVENVHYKSNYLEQASNINVLHTESTENDVCNNGTVPPGSETTNSAYNNGGAENSAEHSNQWTLPQFELSAEDALKLGEVTILLLIHDI